MAHASDQSSLLSDHALTDTGRGERALVFLHGFGADQSVWRLVAPRFADRHRVIAYDHMGCGRSNAHGRDAARYGDLGGYAADLAAILDTLDLRDVLVVAHSVAGMMALLAARRTDRIGGIAMVGTSPCYIDQGGYVGGFSRADVEELLSMMELDFQGWARNVADVAIADPGRPELAQELVYSFSRANPELLRRFARATFLCDYRRDLAACTTPVLALQASADALVPAEAAAYLADHIPGARLHTLKARGHYPQLSAPDEVFQEVQTFLEAA